MSEKSAWRWLSPWQPEATTGWADIERCVETLHVKGVFARTERTGEYPLEVVRALWHVGANDCFDPMPNNPRSSPLHACALNELLARHSVSSAITVGINGLALLPLFLWGTNAQRERASRDLREGKLAAFALTERDKGSDVLANTGRADKTDTGFRLNGEKWLINGGRYHDQLMVLLRTGNFDAARATPADFTLFYFERGLGVVAREKIPTAPVRAADISGFALSNVDVGLDAVVGTVGEGFGLAQRALWVSRGGVGSIASGVVTAARQVAHAHAGSHALYGKPLSAIEALSDNLLCLDAGELTVAASAVRAAHAMNAFGPGAVHFTAVAKFLCCEVAERAVAAGRAVGSARFMLASSPYERLVRDVAILGVFEGTSHLMLEQLQWHLAQMAELPLAARADATTMRSMYACAPTHLSQRAGTPRVFPDGPTLTASTARQTSSSVASLVPGLAEPLFELFQELRATRIWQERGPIRLDMARALAHLEGAQALVELGDPSVRAWLEMPALIPDPLRRAAYPFAVVQEVVAACQALSSACASADMTEAPQLRSLVQAATRAGAQARRDYAAVLISLVPGATT